jgi:hypothetical protein
LCLPVPSVLVSDHLLVVPLGDFDPSCHQVQSCPLHLPSPRLLALLHPFELLLEGEESSLDISVGLLLGSVSLHLGDQPPQPHALHLPQQLVVEIGRAGKELIQPGLKGFDRRHVFIIFHFFVCIGVGKYFFDKGGVTGGTVAGETGHHPPREESDPIGLLPNILLEGEHEVGGSLRVIPKVPFGSGMVHGLVLPESRPKFFQSFVSHLVSMAELL